MRFPLVPNWSLTLTLTLTALSGCQQAQQPEELPPLFNAVDDALQCAPGEVSWDATTGGSFDQRLSDATLSSEITIVEATYGSNFDHVAPGNLTADFAQRCNGRLACEHRIHWTAADVAPGQPKAFRLLWRCGTEDRIYERNVPGEAGAQRVTIQCNDKMTLKKVIYGPQCPVTQLDLTSQLAPRCNGARTCVIPRDLLPTFGDPCVGQVKTVDLFFTCAGTNEEVKVTGAEGHELVAECPPRQIGPPPAGQIKIVNAVLGRSRYAGSCSSSGSVTEQWAAECNGKAECTVKVSDPLNAQGQPYDPAQGCAKPFLVEWQCGGDPTTYYDELPGEAGGKSVTIRCGAPMRFVEASFGKNCAGESVKNNGLAVTQRYCDGKRWCNFSGPMLEDLDRAIGDPAFGCIKNWNLRWTCGEGQRERLHETRGHWAGILSCDPEPARPGVLPGLQVVSAEVGRGCSTLKPGQVNNAYGSFAQCNGSDSCEAPFPGIGTNDPAPGCANLPLDVDYRCGEESTLRSVHIDNVRNASALVSLSCRPPIRVLDATYGRPCAEPDQDVSGNYTRAVTDVCGGRTGTCTYPLPSDEDTCAVQRPFSVSYTCGAELVARAAQITRSPLSATLACPDSVSPATQKRCIPERCFGDKRRAFDMSCAPNPALPVAEDAYAAEARLLVGEAGTTPAPQDLQASQPYRIAGYMWFRNCPACSRNASLNAPTLAKLTVWAYDTFRNAAGNTVEGFRCIVASPGLRSGEAADAPTSFTALAIQPSISGQVVGNLPSSCFGSEISSWRDAAKRVGMVEADFRREYTISSRSKLGVSFDPEGRMVASRGEAGWRRETALVPNPLGFYYAPGKHWVDMLGFYRQTTVQTPLTGAEFGFVSSRDIRLEAVQLKARTANVSVALYEPFELPELEFELTWKMLGDSPGLNPFSPTGRKLSASVSTLAERGWGLTFEITPATEQKNGLGWVADDRRMLLVPPRDVRLSGGSPSGQIIRAKFKMPAEVRDRVLRLKQVDNDGWREVFDQSGRDFLVRACIDVQGLERTESSLNDTSPLRSSRNEDGANIEYTAGFTPGLRCAGTAVAIDFDLEHRPFPLKTEQGSPDVASTDSSGDSKVQSSAVDTASSSGCQKTCTVTADCPAAQTCEVKAGDRIGVCVGGMNKCEIATRNAGQGQGQQTGSIGRTSTSAVSTSHVVAGLDGGLVDGGVGTGSASSGSEGDLASFAVIAASDGKEALPTATTTGWQEVSIGLVPNIDGIKSFVKAFNLTSNAKPTPFSARMEAIKQDSIQDGKPGRAGLGFGIGKTYKLSVGPLPIWVDWFVGAGLSIGASITFGFRSDYRCINSTGASCVTAITGRQSVRAQKQVCSDQGGRLSEMENAAEGAAVLAAISSAPPGTDFFDNFYAIGGQAGYFYGTEACQRNPTGPGCVDGATMRFRWLESGNQFAEKIGAAPSSGVGQYFNSPFTSLLVNLDNRPSLVAMHYQNGHFFPLKTALLDNVGVRAVCTLEGFPNVSQKKFAFNSSIGLSAGSSFSVCTPTNFLGICIGGGVNLFSAEFAYEYEWTGAIYTAVDGKQKTEDEYKNTIFFEAKFLSAAFSAQLKLLITDIEWIIWQFQGVQSLANRSPDGTYRGELKKILFEKIRKYENGVRQ